MKNDIRNSGIDIIGNVPCGTHFCQFYQTKADLMDISIPFLKTGLENNELCLWLIAEPLDLQEAEDTLRKAVPDFDVFLGKGQIELSFLTDLQTKDGIFDSEQSFNSLAEKANKALSRGYNGLRVIKNVCLRTEENRNDFENSEKILDSVIAKYPIIALCTCSLDLCSATDRAYPKSNIMLKL
jgi:hypothetical protein